MNKQVNINLADCKDITCDCGCGFFAQAFIIKRIPGVMVGSTTDVEHIVQILVCAKCGTPRFPWVPEEQKKSPLIMK